ncbi:hypothetical protein J5I95_19720 [Candidatus Poribacteria bacterium]|nr:hypothetical protein [Candidatus Poribacteria bacterium]
MKTKLFSVFFLLFFLLTLVSKTAAAQKATTVALEAKAAAEQDASKDTNEPLWFCIGTPLPFAFVYACGGGLMILNPSEFTGGIIDLGENGARVVGFASLALSASCIGIVGRGIFAEKTPPADRLIGNRLNMLSLISMPTKEKCVRYGVHQQ